MQSLLAHQVRKLHEIFLFILTVQSSCIILEEDMNTAPTTYILAEILISKRHSDLCQDCCLLCTIWRKFK